MDTETRLYEMKLHDVIWIDDNIRILRVPGGWVYTISGARPVFVPLCPEFKNHREG